ncbi:MAG: RNA polymerase sigma factor [bacterium]
MKRETSGLIERMLEGDRTSFDDIVAWYSADVLRLCCLLLREPEEARDVAQESYLRLVELVKKKKFRTRNGSIKGFLITTARNLCIDRLKKRIHFCSVDEEHEISDTRFVDTYSPDAAMEETRLRSAFEKALTHLNDAQRAILILHELNGESQQNIANELKLSLNAVRTQLCRARRKMRILLTPYVGQL